MYLAPSRAPLLELNLKLALIFRCDRPLQGLNHAVVDLLNILYVLELLGRLSHFPTPASLLLLLLLSDVLNDLVVAGYSFCGHLITLLLHQSQLCLGLGLSSQGRLLLLLLAPTHLLHLDQRDVEVLLRRGRHANLGHRC